MESVEKPINEESENDYKSQEEEPTFVLNENETKNVDEDTENVGNSESKPVDSVTENSAVEEQRPKVSQSSLALVPIKKSRTKKTEEKTTTVVMTPRGGLQTVEVFKTPQIPLKKKRRILEEDQFVQELEKIIQRDFFPDLEKIKAQNAYLNAVENNDIHMIRELYSKYTFGKQTPLLKSTRSTLETPSTFETPLGFDGSGTPQPETESTPTHRPMENASDGSDTKSEAGESKKSEKNYSLNEFLDKYTSEDNQSFQDIMDESDRKHKIKYNWLYDAEKTHADQMKNALTLPSMEEQALEYKRPLNIDTWGYKNQNYVMYVPEGTPFTPEEAVAHAKKQAVVNISNTRFNENPFKTPITSQPTNKIKLFGSVEGKFGIDGKEIDTSTPKVNGFSYVRTPSPNPGVQESPFMTWGEIEGTPFRLDASDTPTPSTNLQPFKILDQSAREKVAMDLAEKVSQRYRDKKQKAIEAARSHLATPSPKPKNAFERLCSMSPAAMKFAKTTLGSKLSTHSALRSSYTPKVTPSSSRTPTPSRSTSSRLGKSGKTPAKTPTFSSSSTRRDPATPSLDNLTDNLLNLPKTSTNSRTRASEYF